MTMTDMDEIELTEDYKKAIKVLQDIAPLSTELLGALATVLELYLACDSQRYVAHKREREQRTRHDK